MFPQFDLDHDAALAVTRLALDPDVESIWLVGSRANGEATSGSDWDLMVFVRAEPRPREGQDRSVDVIRVGPEGSLLVDGCSEDFRQDFSGWHWEQVSETEASYLAKKEADRWPDDDEDDAFDGFSAPPAFLFTRKRAFLLWSRARKVPVWPLGQRRS